MKQITIAELKQMTNKEGLILQGCGGDLNEWVDGINSSLTEMGILKNGDVFYEVSVFENEGHTNMLFHFDDVSLDIGKLAIWRLQTHSNFGGTWLSDYLANRFDRTQDAPLQNVDKPDCALIGTDGNIFSLMGIASKTLKRNDMPEQAKEMCERIFECGSYENALNIIGEYVNITSADDAPGCELETMSGYDESDTMNTDEQCDGNEQTDIDEQSDGFEMKQSY